MTPRDPWWKRIWTSQIVIMIYGLGALIVGYFLGSTATGWCLQ